jgi:hypothetical protein
LIAPPPRFYPFDEIQRQEDPQKRGDGLKVFITRLMPLIVAGIGEPTTCAALKRI